VADVVADRIRILILTGRLDHGDRLPPLEAMVQEFGVSVPSVREALRILEAEGLVTVLRGSGGGAVVHRPDADTAAYNAALVLSSQGTDFRDVLDALDAVEPMCAMFCARRPDRKRTVVPTLRKLNVAARQHLGVPGTPPFTEPMIAFHETLVEKCGNKSLTLLVGILESIWLAKARTLSHRSRENLPGKAAVRALEIHEEIYDLILAGEDVRVAEVVAEHIRNNTTQFHFDASEQVDARAIRLRKRIAAPTTTRSGPSPSVDRRIQ
jgi:DNA-binding FadR family transcriptional regulator